MLETLDFTMSTITQPSGLLVNTQPPPTLDPVPGETNLFKGATAAQARENNRRPIEPLKSVEEALGEGIERV